MWGGSIREEQRKAPDQKPWDSTCAQPWEPPDPACLQDDNREAVQRGMKAEWYSEVETNLWSPTGQGKGFRVCNNCHGKLWKIKCGDIIFFTLQKNHGSSLDYTAGAQGGSEMTYLLRDDGLGKWLANGGPQPNLIFTFLNGYILNVYRSSYIVSLILPVDLRRTYLLCSPLRKSLPASGLGNNIRPSTQAV